MEIGKNFYKSDINFPHIFNNVVDVCSHSIYTIAGTSGSLGTRGDGSWSLLHFDGISLNRYTIIIIFSNNHSC